MLRETTIQPDLTQLNDFLLNYGYPQIRVPLVAIRADVTPWEVGVDLTFTDVTEQDCLNPIDWRKRILERINAMIVGMRSIGWIIHGRLSIDFDSQFEPPTCTLGGKLVKTGQELQLSANTSFTVLPIKGELIERG